MKYVYFIFIVYEITNNQLNYINFNILKLMISSINYLLTKCINKLWMETLLFINNYKLLFMNYRINVKL